MDLCYHKELRRADTKAQRATISQPQHCVLKVADPLVEHIREGEKNMVCESEWAHVVTNVSV